MDLFLLLLLFGLFLAAIVVYIILVRRKDRSEKNNAVGVIDMDWMAKLIDKID